MINPKVTRRYDGGWDFAWTGGTPPYAIWLDGQQLATTTAPAFSSGLAGYETVPPDLEILSAGDPSQNEASPPYQLLQWRGNQNAFAYVVSQLIASTCVVVRTIYEKGLGYYQWQSPAQPDGQVVEYQVQASDVQGNVGAALPFTLEVCRNPLHPSVTVDFGSSGALTIGAAS